MPGDGGKRLEDRLADAARRAKDAGFDGVELHGANGYLLDQFARDGSNHRTDRYGGSAKERIRFPVEVAAAVADTIGADRVGYRVSPRNGFNDMHDSDPGATFSLLAQELGRLGLAYLHHVETSDDPRSTRTIASSLRTAFTQAGGHGFIANGGYTQHTAEQRVAAREADAVAFGTLFIANPDLPERFQRQAPLAEADPSTYYGGDQTGYTDYPALDAVNASGV